MRTVPASVTLPGITLFSLYLLGVLLDPRNEGMPLPVVLTGPRDSAPWFEQMAAFIEGALGAAALERLSFVPDDPAAVARQLVRGCERVREFRRARSDSYNFNWLLAIPPDLQRPFEPTHAGMGALGLRRGRPVHELAADLRRAFSGIVSGNVKQQGIAAIRRHGPYRLNGDAGILGPLDRLLSAFAAQGRMKLPGSRYQPCYELVA